MKTNNRSKHFRPTQKSLELCLHLWDRNRSASWIWNQKPADVSGRFLPTSLATLPPARQSDIVQNMQQNRSSGFRYWSPKRVVEIRLKKHQPNFWTVGFRLLEYLAFPCRMRSFLVKVVVSFLQGTAGWGSLECCLKQKHRCFNPIWRLQPPM